MKTAWTIGITIGAIALVTTTFVLMFYRSDNSSIALSEEWTVIDVADGNSITVRRTDGSQLSVELCGIEGELGQSWVNEAKNKLRKLVAAADNQVLIIPVAKDSQGRTIAEVMAYGEGEADISFEEELLKSGLAKTYNSGVTCPNQLAFEQAQNMGKASKVGMWSH